MSCFVQNIVASCSTHNNYVLYICYPLSTAWRETVKKLLFQVTKWSMHEVHSLHTINKEHMNFRLKVHPLSSSSIEQKLWGAPVIETHVKPDAKYGWWCFYNSKSGPSWILHAHWVISLYEIGMFQKASISFVSLHLSTSNSA